MTFGSSIFRVMEGQTEMTPRRVNQLSTGLGEEAIEDEQKYVINHWEKCTDRICK